MKKLSFLYSQWFYSVLMGVSAMLMFLSLHPEQHFKGLQHPFFAAALVFFGVYAGYRLAYLKPEISISPLRLRLNKHSPDFFISLVAAAIFLAISDPGLQYLLQFFLAALIAIGYYTISRFHQHTFGGFRSVFLVKNITLALAWALTSAPVHPGEIITLYHFGERFLFLLSLSLLIDLRDLHADKATFIRTVAGRAGERVTRILSIFFLIMALVLSYGYSNGTGEQPLLLAGSVSYSLTLISALFLTEKSSRQRYLLLVDGNLLLYGILAFTLSRL